MGVDFKTKEYRCLQNFRSLWIKTICLTLLLNLNYSLNLYAQVNDIQFEHISLEQGLSQATVWTIIQDSQGFMWFGTADGLNKYDGYNFTVYNHDPRDSTSISDSRIMTIYEDKSGTLWIGTAGGGLNKFDRENEKFIHYKHTPSNPNSLSSNHVMSIYEDRPGTLWIGTAGGGFNKFDRETERFEHYKHDPANPNSLSNNHVFPICEGKSGVLWLGTNGGGLNRFDKDHENFTHYKHDPAIPHSLSHDVINVIYKDKSGTLWIGTDDGLDELVLSEAEGLVPSSTLRRSSGRALSEADGHDRAKVKFEHYKHDPVNPNSLSNNMIYSIHEDKSGRLWIGTARGGLNKLVPSSSSEQALSVVEGSGREKETFVHYKNDPYNPNSLSDNRVRSIFEDNSGVLWIGTHGRGLNKFNRFKQKFVHYKNDPSNLNSLSNNRVYSIYQDKAGIFWIGTSGGGLNKFDQEKETFVHYKHDPSELYGWSHNIVSSIYEDKSGALWIGTYGGGLNRFDRSQEKFVQYKNDLSNPNSLSNNFVRVIFEDKSSVLWIGTDGGGLNKFDRKKETFTLYKNNPSNPYSLSHNWIRCIFEDKFGVLWIGTYGGGLNRFDCSKEKFVHYKHDPATPNSLSNNYVLSIYEDLTDSGSTFWIGTYGGGLNKLVLREAEGFDRVEEEFAHFTENDGLANNVVYGILGDDHGNLWLSTNKGLSKLNPQNGNFKNYDVNDGLQSNEFNTGAYFKSRNGEMFFGGINGFNAFYPDSIKDNPYIPPVVITAFKSFDEIIRRDISNTQEVELSYKDKYLEFGFVALDYTNPQKNQYAYLMAGFDQDWNYSGTRRFATYTNLDAGEYVFSVKGSNSDGIWNEGGVSIKIVITPPFWETWWFLTFSALSLTLIGYSVYRRKLHTNLEKARILSELTAAHDMQMGLMPASDPVIEGFDISGICEPAEEVGGDYFDYIWLDKEQTKFGIAIVDVSAKAMNGAMTAVMTSGMVYSEVCNTQSPRIILQKINRLMYLKTKPQVFTAMSFAVIDTQNKTLTFSNAGQTEPILKRNSEIQYLNVEGLHFPLGVKEEVEYREVTVQLERGDMILFYTDGVQEARNEENELFDFERMETIISHLQSQIRAEDVVKTLLNEVGKFSGTAQQHDDLTVVVVRVV